MAKPKISWRAAMMRAYWAKRGVFQAQTSSELRWRIIGMLGKGLAKAHIARELAVSRSTVRYWEARWLDTGAPQTLPVHLGCPHLSYHLRAFIDFNSGC